MFACACEKQTDIAIVNKQIPGVQWLIIFVGFSFIVLYQYVFSAGR